MKIKVLECPLWVKHAYTSSHIKMEFDEIEPVFRRDGYYLIDNKYVVVEYQGFAWRCKNEQNSVRAFRWELEDAEYKGINILSKEQSDAIYTLMKINLASEMQEDIFRRDYGKRDSRKYWFKLNKRR